MTNIQVVALHGDFSDIRLLKVFIGKTSAQQSKNYFQRTISKTARIDPECHCR